ncbi:MAG: proprotein convertase P-domain-containing protein [Deltaproteobacteria bacterium]|nr:proprotein convertase P-domain-containing protein [Deltaproteobacteria bacterium]
MKTSLTHAARACSLALFLIATPQCSSNSSDTETPANVDDGPNPFLEDNSGKADQGYLNLAGIEVEVTLEADIQAPSYDIHDSPPNLAQFAVTYMRKRQDFYIQILAEDETAPDAAEWLVDGTWIPAAQTSSVPKDKLTHFRMAGVNTVVLNGVAKTIAEGQVFKAKVPIAPYSIMKDAGEACGESGGHIGLSQSTYWYLWDPDLEGCKQELLQDMTITVTKKLPKNPPSYPEYDQLWADNELTAVVLFGELDDGSNIKEDWNWKAADRFVTWLKNAGFSEQSGATLGRRFSKTIGDKKETVDVYYPDLFKSVADYANYKNFQTAVSEHEVVVYLGHSVLGTGSAYDEMNYPSFYQIMFIGGCLGYEYYVRPVLKGKAGWEKVDAVASIVENLYTEMNPATGEFLAKLFYGFEHKGNASWQEIMAAINNRLGHAHFGVAGARGNCFSPDGRNLCSEAPVNAKHYESTAAVSVPDNTPAGVTSTINVPDTLKIGTLMINLDITHTYVGDLKLSLTHGGVTQVIRDQVGGSQKDIMGAFAVDAFKDADAAGDWVLTIADVASADTGTLNSWSLDIVAAP